MKLAALLLACLAGSAGILALVLASGSLELPLQELEARYATPQSRFLDIDGVRVHYMDEGTGPALVLLHASFMSLRQWDPLAADLSKGFRVVRLDLLNAGLTGPEPTDDYSMERNAELVHGLTAALGLDRFALLGTSSGGTVAFRYAAAHPEKVRQLILVNSAGMPRTPATDPNRARGFVLERWIQQYHRSRTYWRETLALQFTSGMAPPDSLVEMVYDMNRRAGLRRTGALFMRNYQTGDPEATLARITAPTLVLWGLGNITVSHLEADVFEHWLTAAPSLKKKYPAVGHYLYLEIPAQFNAELRAFLAGKLDGELRRLQRVPALPGAAGSATGTPQ